MPIAQEIGQKKKTIFNYTSVELNFCAISIGTHSTACLDVRARGLCVTWHFLGLLINRKSMPPPQKHKNQYLYKKQEDTKNKMLNNMYEQVDDV